MKSVESLIVHNFKGMMFVMNFDFDETDADKLQLSVYKQVCFDHNIRFDIEEQLDGEFP